MNAVTLYHPEVQNSYVDAASPPWTLSHARPPRQTGPRVGWPRFSDATAPVASTNGNAFPATPLPTRRSPEDVRPLFDRRPDSKILIFVRRIPRRAEPN